MSAKHSIMNVMRDARNKERARAEDQCVELCGTVPRFVLTGPRLKLACNARGENQNLCGQCSMFCECRRDWGCGMNDAIHYSGVKRVSKGRSKGRTKGPLSKRHNILFCCVDEKISHHGSRNNTVVGMWIFEFVDSIRNQQSTKTKATNLDRYRLFGSHVGSIQLTCPDRNLHVGC